MSNAETIVRFLSDYKEGICDDCISEKTGITPRQQTNQICNRLSVKKLLARNNGQCGICGGFKMTNIFQTQNLHGPQTMEQKKETSTEVPVNLHKLEVSVGSNKERGNTFARRVANYFLKESGLLLTPEYPVAVGLSSQNKKIHCFDFGNEQTLVECKYYGWTEGGNNPSAKISTLNEAMLYFVSAPAGFRKILFLPKTRTKGVRFAETFLEYYVRRYKHLIPDDVEIWEFDEGKDQAIKKHN